MDNQNDGSPRAGVYPGAGRSQISRPHATQAHMSEKHLNRYVTEFAGRHNNRDADTIDQMARMAHDMVGKRLRYEDLVA